LEVYHQEGPAAPITVLVVDDCPNLRTVLEEVLRSNDFIVRSAKDASEALWLMDSVDPDVVVSDIMMPEADGFSLQRSLREHPKWCHIPFIFLSALTEPEDVRAGKESGCDEYITKPFDPEDLKAAITGKATLAKQRRAKSEAEFEGYRKRIIHTLSHEFRTPLVAINTGAELLLDRAEDLEKEQFRKLLESVHRGGLRLQRLVEDFMSLQQIETGAAKKVAERLKRKSDIESLAKESIDFYADLRQDNSMLVEIRNEIANGERVVVDVYDAQVHSILSRLLSNAHKFAGATYPASLIIRATMDTASLIVRDHGPGMKEELALNACELFSQLDRDKLEQQGCGIGLTIATHYALYNGGKLFFHTPYDGIGLAVELRLPRVG
jgi:two-component system, sensor histidine kinase and response regulator